MKRLSPVLFALTLIACNKLTPARLPETNDHRSSSHEAKTQADGSTSQSLKRIRQVGTLIYYAGTLRLSGTYAHRQDPDPTTIELLSDQICFSPDETSAHLIPRSAEDPRDPWFCFANRERALALLSLPAVAPTGSCGVEGTATVLVSHYVVDRTETETFDTAQLDEVAQVSPPVPLACSEEE